MRESPRDIRDRVLQNLQNHGRIAVVGHVRPDGDCIGSQLALSAALAAVGKEVRCWNEDPIPSKYRFLDPEGRMQKSGMSPSAVELVVAVDCADRARLGKAEQILENGAPCLNIDHHGSNTRYGAVNWIHPHASSTGEMIYDLFKRSGWPMETGIAECLYVAIATDTGSFQYRNTTRKALRIAADLVGKGVRVGEISTRLYHSQSLVRVRLLQELYRGFQFAADHQIAYFRLTPEILQRTRADRGDTEGLIDHLRAIDPVRVALIFEPNASGEVRVSLRSKSPEVNVAEVAGEFGGGGHAMAAGVRIAGEATEVERRILAALRRVLRRIQD